MFGLFSKKNRDEAEAPLGLVAPFPGRVLDLADVPDPVFSSGVLGPGFAIDPAGELREVRSPVAGTVVTVPETRHAVGLRAGNGAEILVHVGVDTVGLKGEGFTAHVQEGDAVEAGQLLLTVEGPTVAARVPSLITPVVLTNADSFTTSVNLAAPDGAALMEVRAQ